MCVHHHSVLLASAKTPAPVCVCGGGGGGGNMYVCVYVCMYRRERREMNNSRKPITIIVVYV